MADIEPGVTVVAGKNDTGKSSLAIILGALVANETNPAKTDVTNFKAYIHDGAHEGEARIDSDAGTIIWRPQSGIIRPDNMPVWSTAESVGLVDFLARQSGPKARATLWKPLFVEDHDPETLLKEEWGQRGAGDLAATVAIIKHPDKGWDAALAVYEDKMREAKRIWTKVTGEGIHGKRKAASYTPEHWDATLSTASEAELQAELTNARDDLTAITTQVAVTASQIESSEGREGTSDGTVEKGIEAKRTAKMEMPINLDLVSKNRLVSAAAEGVGGSLNARKNHCRRWRLNRPRRRGTKSRNYGRQVVVIQTRSESGSATTFKK